MLIDIDPRDSQSLIASCRYPDKWRLDALPAKAWDTSIRKWAIPIIYPNIAPLRSNFTAAEFTPEAIARIKATLATSQTVSYETPEFTGHLVPGTMAHQRAALAKSQCQEAYFFAHAMGCVSGDTKIQCLLAGGNGKQLTIEQMYHRSTKGLRTRARCLKGEQFGQHDVAQVIYSGVKFTYTLVLSDGKMLRATKDHRILTPDGWRALGELVPGDDVMVNGNTPDKDGYIRTYAPNHPKRWKAAKVVYEHILVAEKLLLGRHLLPGEVVHHKNGIKHDNRPENLEVMLSHDHLSITHGARYRANLDGGISPVSGGKVVVLPKTVQVVSITPHGEEPTYDICMQAPHHNFVANGIVVHNSGKSLTVLTLAAHLHRHQGLTGLLVVCPASIKHDVWQQEVAKWMPDLQVDHDLHILTAGKHAKAISWIVGHTDTSSIKVLVVGIQALSNKDQAAYQVCSQFLTTFKTGMLIDESSMCKNAKASRTKNVIELGGLAHWRWNGTGTKITQGIHDLYAQFRFLDWRILGHKSFHTFKNRYCVMGGFEDKTIISYKNVDELLALIDPHIDVIRKEDANDLPPKTYQTRTVAPSELQTRLFKELKQYMEASVSTEHDLTVATALERMTRYQQLAGGNIPYQDDDGQWHTKPMAVNPKLEELESLVEEIDGKAIIWAVFVPEIRMIAAKLAAAHGLEAVVSYYGGVDVAARSVAVDKFQHDPQCRFFVANQATAGKGLTLTAATTTIYYSNSFSYEDRVQSEDRNHRTGQRHSVTYIDLFVDLPIDRTIKAALTKKTSMSKYVADRLRSGSPTVLEAD